MGGMTGAHHLLGRPDKGELALVVGPDYNRLRRMAMTAGVVIGDATKVRNMEALRESISLHGTSLALLACVPEVEGILDRSAFGPHLTELAYEADRVVYYGTQGGVLVHPQYPGTRVEIRQGSVRIRQHIDEIEPGKKVTGITVDSL